MIHVILADDHQIIRQAIGELLESSGRYKLVAQVNNGKELLAVLEKKSCDVIVIDIAMPQMDGVQAVRAIRQKPLVTPILALSANDDNKSIKLILQAGANGFVPKTSSLQELDFAINSVMRGNAYLSPSITERVMNNDAAQRPSDSLINALTPRELEIMHFLADGKPNREIGKSLHISTRTVDTHRSNILKKLGLKTNAELVRLAISEGLITI
jgi:two-component system, NarL family, response regulator NreC